MCIRDSLNRILAVCLGVVTVTGLILGWGALAGGQELLRIYSTDPEVISYGILRMEIILSLIHI